MKITKGFLGALMLLLGSLVMQGCGDGQADNQNTINEDQDTANHSIEIIAHRGYSYEKPENTMAAVEFAWQKEADAVEVDVYLSADERVVAIHDKTTERTGDKDLPVTETDSEELRTVDVGSFKGEEFAGEQIPFLEEIVASVPDQKRLFIEIKDGAHIVPHVKEIIEESGKEDQMVIISFNLDVVKASKEQMPEIPAYWLLSTQRDATGNHQPIDTALLDTVKQYNLDGLDVRYQGVTPKLVDASHEAGYKLYVWTVNDSSDIAAIAKQGVDGITTDRIIRTQNVLGRDAQ